MYDSLLDARIRLQKCVSSMNRLPNAMQIPDYFVESETKTAADAMLSEALLLADDLFDLQEVRRSSLYRVLDSYVVKIEAHVVQ